MSSPGSRLRAALDRQALLAIAVAVAAAIGIYLGIDAWIGGRAVIKVTGVGPRPIELLEPRWLALVAIAPFFYLVRRWSLTDLSVAQQLVQSTVRTLGLPLTGAVMTASLLAFSVSWAYLLSRSR